MQVAASCSKRRNSSLRLVAGGPRGTLSVPWLPAVPLVVCRELAVVREMGGESHFLPSSHVHQLVLFFSSPSLLIFLKEMREAVSLWRIFYPVAFTSQNEK